MPSDSDRLHSALKWKRRLAEARVDFAAYRRFISPTLKGGWFRDSIEQALQDWWTAYRAGESPVLLLATPPQHGKSILTIDFISWVAGQDPRLKVVFASFSERLGIRANLRLQRIYESERYRAIFPNTQISTSNVVTQVGKHLRNREILEYVGEEGYFRNTTVGGAVTGESLDIGIIDDPVKGREEANSPTMREKVWDWYTDDFGTRFSDGAGVILIMTRWHIDDLAGRIIRNDPAAQLKSYRAIAEEDEEHRKEGEALFPEHKSLDFLLVKKRLMASASWAALYQQHPTIQGGNIIRGEWFGSYTVPPRIKYRMVYVDTAQKTKEVNDFSVAECWGMGDDGKIYLLDLIRGKWEAPELERRITAFWSKQKNADIGAYGQVRQMRVEDAASGTGLIQRLKMQAHIPVAGITRTKDKYTRLTDILGYIEAGYVSLPSAAPYTNDFLAECEAFSPDDKHPHDDQIDPLIDAVQEMLAGGNKISLWEKMI